MSAWRRSPVVTSGPDVQPCDAASQPLVGPTVFGGLRAYGCHVPAEPLGKSRASGADTREGAGPVPTEPLVGEPTVDRRKWLLPFGSMRSRLRPGWVVAKGTAHSHRNDRLRSPGPDRPADEGRAPSHQPVD